MRLAPFVTGALLISAAAAAVAAQQASHSPLVITNVRVFTGERLIERASITVRDGKIASIDADVPAKASLRIDGSGMTALPGLIDAHVHVRAGMDESKAGAFAKDGLQTSLQAFLDHGVTTIMSLADSSQFILQLRRDLQEGKLAGPRLLLVGPAFTAPGGHPGVTFCRGETRCQIETDSPEEARREIRRLALSGVDGIKLVNQGGEILGIPIRKIEPEVMKAIVAEAHAQRLPVIAHTGNESDGLEAIVAGVDALSHLPGRLSSNALLEALKSADRIVITTLQRRRAAGAQTSEPLMKLHDAGVRLVVGSDSGPVPEALRIPALLPGESTLREIEVMVEDGLPPETALKAATSGAAQYLGLEESIGKLARGVTADILLVRGNPLRDIRDLRQVEAVFQAGNIVFRAK